MATLTAIFWSGVPNDIIITILPNTNLVSILVNQGILNVCFKDLLYHGALKHIALPSIVSILTILHNVWKKVSIVSVNFSRGTSYEEVSNFHNLSAYDPYSSFY